MALDVKVRSFIAVECMAEQKAIKARIRVQLKRALKNLSYNPGATEADVVAALLGLGELTVLQDLPDFLKTRAEEIDRAAEARARTKMRGKR